MYSAKHCVNNAFFNQSATKHAQSGMRIMGTTILNPEFTLYKLVQNCTVPSSTLIQSPWWFQAREIRNFLDDARRGQGGEFDATEQARQNAGISKAWSGAGANYILPVKLFAPVRAFFGSPLVIGTSKVGGGVSGIDSETSGVVQDIEIIPDFSCTQFYLPGMKKKAAMCMSVKERVKLRNNAFLLNGDIEGFLRSIS